MRRRGQALILLLLLLSVVAGAVLFSFFNSAKITLDSDQKTADALASAKAALIGYALRGDDCVPQPTCTPQNPQRPGEFPCPDTNNDGFEDGTCVPGRLGRIPWKTLGISEPKDSAGETLWYAIAGPFRSFNSGALNSSPINSDSRGDITVFAADGTTTLTTQAVAVIFAPGPALGPQIRDTTSAPCTTSPSSPVARNRCAANYLDAVPAPPAIITRNNATTNGPFIVGRLRDPGNPNYNDRVLYITTAEFMPAVEMRVAGELRKILQSYYDANVYFPFAAKYDDPTGNCAMNVPRGRLPLRIRVDPATSPPNPVCGTPPSITFPAGTGLAEWPGSLPTWFTFNNWWQVMYYSVAPGYVFGGPNSCAGSKCLALDSDTSIAALFFTPGTPLNPNWRVPGSSLDIDLTHYLEDTPNQDGWGPGANDIYQTPPRTVTTRLDRDRIFIFAGSNVSTPQCGANAQALLALAPCGQPPHLNPQCVTRAANLGGCSCAIAANAIIIPPCQNNLNPPQCQAAVATLNTCNS